MPDGRNNTVDIPITSVAAFLVMKGYAQTVRRFLKDAPDEFTDLDPEQIQTDALGQLRAFLNTLGLE